jgi:hypothetical protein
MRITEDELNYFFNKIDFRASFLDSKALKIMNKLSKSIAEVEETYICDNFDLSLINEKKRRITVKQNPNNGQKYKIEISKIG